MGISVRTRSKLYGWIMLGAIVMAPACGVQNSPQPEYFTYENIAWRLYGQRSSYDLMTNAILENLNKAIDLAPDRVCVDSYILRSQCWLVAGEVNKAFDDWTVAIERDPTNIHAAKAYCGRAVYYGRQKEFQKALSDINQAIILMPNYALAHAVRAIVYKDMGMYEKAKNEMVMAIGMNPNITGCFNCCEFNDAITARK